MTNYQFTLLQTLLYSVIRKIHLWRTVYSNNARWIRCLEKTKQKTSLDHHFASCLRKSLIRKWEIKRRTKISLHPLIVLHLPSVFVNWRRCLRAGERMELSTLGIQYIFKILIETLWQSESHLLLYWKRTCFPGVIKLNSIPDPREDIDLDFQLNHSEFKYIKFLISSNVMLVSYPGKMVWWMRLGVGIDQ